MLRRGAGVKVNSIIINGGIIMSSFEETMATTVDTLVSDASGELAAQAVKKFSSEQELLAYVNNPANYRQAQKKQYQIWCCKPSVGTLVWNCLEDVEYAITSKACFILSGTRGEQWVIKPNKLMQTYTFADGTSINPQTLEERTKQDGTIDWFKVQTIPTAAKVWACFVPKANAFEFQTPWGQMMCNRRGISHGLGDFIIRPDADGKPDINDGYVVNGAVFADTYNNEGFQDCIVTEISGLAFNLVKPDLIVTKPCSF